MKEEILSSFFVEIDFLWFCLVFSRQFKERVAHTPVHTFNFLRNLYVANERDKKKKTRTVFTLVWVLLLIEMKKNKKKNWKVEYFCLMLKKGVEVIQLKSPTFD